MSRKSYFKVDQTDLDKITMADRLHRQMSELQRPVGARSLPSLHLPVSTASLDSVGTLPLPSNALTTTRALMQNQ